MRNYWSLRSGRLSVFLFVFLPFALTAQFSPPEVKFSEGETYLYPINPGQPASLAGTMGELRATHFHSGIDIRTNNQIGLPVLASKSGYVSRITVSPSGYGNVLYITHPDGNTTLYAHLDRFEGKLAEHILQEQYSRRTANVDLYFTPSQFPVKRGDTVALSGNSGSSGGPHLHFDIRDKDNNALNPLLVHEFAEVVDKLPPAIEKIALKTLDNNSRINDKFGRFEFYAQKVGNDFVFNTPILATGNMGVEVLAKDKLAPGSPFYGGVNYFEMAVNGDLTFSQSIDKIDIAETRAIYTLMDFKTMRLSGNRFYKLYVDDGNPLKFYEKSPSAGKINLAPGKDTDVKITMRDSYGNASNISFKLKPTPLIKEVKLLEPMKSDIEYDIEENTLVVSTKPCFADSNRAVLFSRNNERSIEPSYFNQNRVVYLIDLRNELPDSVRLCDKKVVTNLKAIIPSGQAYNYYSDIIDIQFPENALYDSVYLTTFRGIRTTDSVEIFNIGSRTSPLNKSINVVLRPQNQYQWDSTHAVYRVAGRDAYAYVGGKWENGGIHFSTREFGDFVVLKDKAEPSIKPVVINGTIAKFKIRDNLSGINTYEASIDSKWLLMHFDAKTGTIWSEKLNKKEALKGSFVLVVTDNAGNRATFKKQIIP